MANQLHIVMINKLVKKAVVMDATVQTKLSIKKKEHKKLEKYQGLKEEVEKMWKVSAAVVRPWSTQTPKLESSRFQEQNQRSLSRRTQSEEQLTYGVKPSTPQASGGSSKPQGRRGSFSL